VKLLGLFLFLILTILNCTNNTKPYTIRIDDSLADGVFKSDKQILKFYTEKAIDSITFYFSISYTETLEVYIIENEYGRSSATRGMIFLNKKQINQQGTILHETTHALLKTQLTKFQTEGLAELMTLTFCANRDKAVYNRIMQLGPAQNSSIFPIQTLMQNDSLFRKRKYSQIAYAQAGLFYY